MMLKIASTDHGNLQFKRYLLVEFQRQVTLYMDVSVRMSIKLTYFFFYSGFGRSFIFVTWKNVHINIWKAHSLSMFYDALHIYVYDELTNRRHPVENDWAIFVLAQSSGCAWVVVVNIWPCD